ncbi:FMN-binding protein [Tissierella pigra]|uniref:FMN-binding protein n=1 Tax=Tissierella pigra TaxID=2607614 RepID=A0A6N7XYH4_9FIRM|nr:FMN-binding protein [Tissierella pigra]MSU02867.1 FMN-binding protein [Tissierella pigra]
MKKKVLALGLSVVVTAAIFTGCTKKEPTPVDENKPGVNETAGETNGNLVDGTYLVKTEVSDHGNYSMAKLEVKDGQIEALDYNEYLVDSGDAKNESNYPYAEGIAVIKDLNAQFNDKKDLNAVDFDAVSGATSTKGTFKEITGQLLDKASKGETYTPVFKDGEYEAKAEEASHGWLAEVKVKVQDGQIVGVDYAEIAVEDADGVKVGDRKSADNYAYEPAFEVAKAMQKLIVDNNGTENLNVDSITGATTTRTTVIELVNQALSSAK